MVRCRGVTASDHTQGHTTVGRTPQDEETNLRYDQNFLKKTAVHNTTKFALEFHFVLHFEPIPVADRSKEWVCSRSPAGIAGFESRRGHGCLL
jgi:hypothetical protein